MPDHSGIGARRDRISEGVLTRERLLDRCRMRSGLNRNRCFRRGDEIKTKGRIIKPDYIGLAQ